MNQNSPEDRVRDLEVLAAFDADFVRVCNVYHQTRRQLVQRIGTEHDDWCSPGAWVAFAGYFYRVSRICGGAVFCYRQEGTVEIGIMIENRNRLRPAKRLPDGTFLLL